MLFVPRACGPKEQPAELAFHRLEAFSACDGLLTNYIPDVVGSDEQLDVGCVRKFARETVVS